eukprot:NODE_2091_length_655_cov_66.731061_g2041_i0.p2 GENE.NODE_2091_length_655_cov_66.731061_g2041_i0~~NODE_2091_length_655_cov_66.731061_g2041_i0.p2  ORF type:complete len:175 (-),score=48.99 NODE_2091_length_655_cov_66.731061_g2041_i0:55-579(-)
MKTLLLLTAVLAVSASVVSTDDNAQVGGRFTCWMCKKLAPYARSPLCEKKCADWWHPLRGSCDYLCEKLLKYEPSAACTLAGFCSATLEAENNLNQQLAGVDVNGLGPEITPCLSAREKMTKGLLGGYVPHCDDDGSFSRVQCWGSTGYCWCVEKQSGKTIPGTKVRGQPKCPE